MNETKVIVPTIHLNGSSASNLLEEIAEAQEAIHNTLEKLYAMSPNARDYYVQGDGATRKAVTEHLNRIESICKVRDELRAISDGIHVQIERKIRQVK